MYIILRLNGDYMRFFLITFILSFCLFFGASIAAQPDNIAVTKRDQALLWASKNGYSWLVSILLNMGADVSKQDKNGYSALMLASLAGDLPTGFVVVPSVIAQKFTRSSKRVQDKYKDKYIKTIKQLINAGADVNQKNEWEGGYTALIVAVSHGHSEIVQLLLDAGAGMNAETPTGRNALMFAAQVGNIELINLLLNAGANVNFQDPSRKLSALMDAVLSGSWDTIETIELLLARGADVNAKDAEGRTALMHAAEGGDSDIGIIKLLLEAGADVSLRNHMGMTALDIAKEKAKERAELRAKYGFYQVENRAIIRLLQSR